MTFKPFYSALAKDLNRGSTRAALGLFGFRNHALREHMRSLYQSPVGSGASFLADPVFEATFGWQPATKTISDLSGTLLQPTLVDALINPAKLKKEFLTDPWEPSRYPYKHQLEAWEALKEHHPARSVLVSSGTGSGKTECFLIPILNDLAREAEQKQQVLTGVRALFLYPLNALIKSQRDRLNSWLAADAFKNRVRYCLYKGDTEEQSPRLMEGDFACEVRGRDVLRRDPPPILVTNSTMLEYMLVRDKDQPIIDGSIDGTQGTLRWIVIDEAHNYIGSQAAELTLLLRRVLHAFKCKPEQVHFVATSATIAGHGEKSDNALRLFLSQIAGVSEEQVTVVTGHRSIPVLEKEYLKRNQPVDLSVLKQMESSEKYVALASNAKARHLRLQLISSAQVLSSLTKDYFGGKETDKNNEMLELLDVCTQGVLPQNNADDKQFLPLRGHFFHRGQTGLWACVNPCCLGRKGTHLEDVEWGFGKVFLDKRLHCDEPDCGYPVFELVQCGECGEEYLAASVYADSTQYKLVSRDFVEDEDEFQEVVELSSDDEELEDRSGEVVGSVLLIKDNNQHATRQKLLVDNILVEVDAPEIGVFVSQIIQDDKDALRCQCCRKREYVASELFRPIRLGAPFLLQTSTPTLLKYMKPLAQGNESLPLDGRRLISFTDSRQGTARFAAKLQQSTERNFIESFLYHRIADALVMGVQEDMSLLEQQRDALTDAINAGQHFFQSMLDDVNKKLVLALNPSVSKLTWAEAKSAIQANSDCDKWIFPTLKENTALQSDSDLAELCLLREFLVRPKRQYSLEGLGLLRLNYTQIQQLKTVPAVFSQRSVTLEEWHDLVQLVLDHYVRTNKALQITEDMFRWMGAKGKATRILAPNVYGDDKHWPTTENQSVWRSWLIRLLAYAFNLEVTNPIERRIIEEMLLATWSGVRTCLTADGADTYLLDLGSASRVVEIMQVREAWVCPVTRRLLPVTFRGITPYLPTQLDNDDLALCKKVTLPVVPTAFWSGSSDDKVQEWIETNPEIVVLRDLGVWTDLNDRIVGFSQYFKTVEHSAQIISSQLTSRENRFKKGQVNLMSCSTTMEMGVDIGGLTGVAMNNVPPHPANFLQRAGRAGRRGETASVSFTLCKSTPHGEAVFRNPLWPFTTALAMPRVSLKSDRIVQRHINALCLTEFLKAQVTTNPLTYEVGQFFEQALHEISSPSRKFQSWLQNGAIKEIRVVDGIAQLTRLTCLEGMLTQVTLSITAVMMADVETRWFDEINALKENLLDVATASGETRPERDINMRLERIRGEYLLRELANRGFLPGYGFPTSVVSLVNKTLEDKEIKNKQISLLTPEDKKRTNGREDNRAIKAGYPSRGLAYALRDYAPGTDTVINQRVYRSGGVTLNWHIPADADAGAEIQSRRWAWQCNHCGGAGTRASLPEQCPHCGYQEREFQKSEYLEPAGFAVDIRYKAHNDISLPQYIPVRDPWISLDGADWLYLPTSSLGRYRSSASGSIFQYTDGLHGTGYGICLKCGRADSMKSDGDFSSVFFDEHNIYAHKRLRGGQENNHGDELEKECPGSKNLVRRSVLLGMETHTDIFELQLRNTSANLINQKSATSLAVALREALAKQLGVEARELGYAVRPSVDVNKEKTYSIYLFDSASDGAGYATQAHQDLSGLFGLAKEVLSCIRHCDTACHGCLLSYDTQYVAGLLERHAALKILDEIFLLGLSLPSHLQVFGPSTRLEVEPIHLAMQRELRKRVGVSLFRIHLAGETDQWEPTDWNLLSDLIGLRGAGVVIELVIHKTDFDKLQTDQKNQLASLIAIVGADTYVCNETIDPQVPQVVLAINHAQGSSQWACTARNALTPNNAWGSSDEENIFVMASKEVSIPTVPNKWVKLLASDIQVLEANAIELSITTELNVALGSFGDKAWQLILDKAPELGSLIKGEKKLIQVTYSDRYIRSPDTVIFLRIFLLALKKLLGEFDAKGSLLINTCPVDLRNVMSPRFSEHDWRDAQDRKNVIECLFRTGYGHFVFTELQAHDLPHARVLTLKWDDDSQWDIRFDQGFGYWRSKANQPFPFERGIPKQLETIAEMDFPIGNAQYSNVSLHPTFIYIVKH